MKKSIFEPFPPSSKDEWLTQAIRDIRGKDYQKTLTSLTPDGIRIHPYYAMEDRVPGLAGYHNSFHPASESPGLSARLWANVAAFEIKDEKSSNKDILHALMNGVDGIVLKTKGDVTWETLLEGVEISYIKIYLEPLEKPNDVWESFKAWIVAKEVQHSELQGGIIWDGFAKALEFREDRENLIEQSAYLIKSANDYPNFRPVSIRFSCYHKAGATAVLELGYGFASLVELADSLSMRGLSAQEVFSSCLVCMEAGSDFFAEIAKIKAARVFFHQLATLYGLSIDPESIEIMAGTSHWTKTSWDLQSNFLRNTTEAMAAILGGCNALLVGTHDFSDSGSSLRMARNISNILKEEAFFDKVVDPAAGSYYVEALVQEILEKTKSKLLDIEKQGGWYGAYDTLTMQAQIRAVRTNRMQAVLEGKSSKIGLNKYALAENRPRLELPTEESWQLVPWRESLMFEYQNQDQA